MSKRTIKLPKKAPKKPQFTKEQIQYIQSAQQITQKLSQKLAKKLFGSTGTWEKGAEKVDELTTEVGEICKKKFYGLIQLDELIVFFGYILGNQAAIGAVYKKMPLTTSRFVEAGKLFEASTRIAYESTLAVLTEKIKVAKSMPKKN